MRFETRGCEIAPNIDPYLMLPHFIDYSCQFAFLVWSPMDTKDRPLK
jgi:hypothetical protein